MWLVPAALGHLLLPGNRSKSKSQLWLKWAMHLDLHSHLWLEPGKICKTTTTKNAVTNSSMKKKIYLLPVPEAVLLCM